MQKETVFFNFKKKGYSEKTTNEFTSAKNDNFSASNSSIIELLYLISSSSSLIDKVLLLDKVSLLLSLLLES